jgi:hypothetical protein
MTPADLNRLRERREHIAQHHGALLSLMSAILFRHDPIGINFEDNTDEYDAEAATILNRLRPGIGLGEARRIVHEEFVQWFERDIAGPEEKYIKIASELLAAYEKAGSPIV